MRSRAAQMQTLNRRLVPPVSKEWAHSEELIERQFAVEDVAAVETVIAFQVRRRDDPGGDDELGQARSEAFEDA